MLDKPLVPEYNVLVLGETQSGKSTLIQCMRKYANPNTAIDTTALGTGFLSHTRKVNTTTITTDLPEYSVVDKSGANINHSKFIKMHDGNDFEDTLNMRHGLATTKGRPRLSKSAKFTIIDTPGFNSTGSDDEQNVQSIFNALNKTTTIHLIIITISMGPFTHGLKDAIKIYVNMFPGVNGTIAFVNTQFDYKNFHSTRAQVSHAIEHRMECLRGIMGLTAVPSFKIDCNLNSKRPIRNCITHNTIQKILELATLSQPVHILQSVLTKTRKMREIDNILRPQFESALADIERTTRWLQDPKEGELQAEIFCGENRTHQPQARIKALEELFVLHNAALPYTLHDDRFDKKYEVIGEGQTTSIYHQETRVLYLPIDKGQLCHQVQVAREFGRGGDGVWQTYSLPELSSHCLVKITSRKCQVDIEERCRESGELQRKLEGAIGQRQEDVHYQENWPQEIKDLFDDLAEKVRVLRFLVNDFLMPEVFEALMDAKVYIGDTAQCLKKAREVYTKLAKRKRG